MSRNALFIDYEYCTGCHACEVACKQEHGFPSKTQNGITVFKMGPWKTDDPQTPYIFNFVPAPTDLCDLCESRVAEGKLPTCVHHCQAMCLEYGPVEELADKAAAKAKTAIFVPR